MKTHEILFFSSLKMKQTRIIPPTFTLYNFPIALFTEHIFLNDNF